MKPAGISNDADYQRISEHLQYELRMLIHSMQRLREHPPDLDDDCFAYLESFFLHVRNLIAFLYDEEPKKVAHQDVLAEHFCDDGQIWRGKRDAKDQICVSLGNTRVLAHKYLAHITYDRDQPHSWNIRQITRELAEILEIFLARAKPERLVKGVEDNIRELIRLNQNWVLDGVLLDGVLVLGTLSSMGPVRTGKIRQF